MMNKREATIVSAFTGVMISDMESLQNYAEKVLDRPILTHEFGDEELLSELREASRDDMLSILDFKDE